MSGRFLAAAEKDFCQQKKLSASSGGNANKTNKKTAWRQPNQIDLRQTVCEIPTNSIN